MRVCGKSFGARSHVNRRGVPLKTPERYYGCKGMKDAPGFHNCRRPTELYASTLERAVWRKVAEAFANPKALTEMLEARNARKSQELRSLRERLEEAQRRLSKKRLELQRVLAWARDRLITTSSPVCQGFSDVAAPRCSVPQQVCSHILWRKMGILAPHATVCQQPHGGVFLRPSPPVSPAPCQGAGEENSFWGHPRPRQRGFAPLQPP
ncbi:MAG: hypothetical protein Q8O40_16080 [Chloroflexota bacterium]|nr:hypothetical protein [Chloroflexota bacterium]